MTKEEKEILINLFKSFKHIPILTETCTEVEKGRNQALDWCIEEIQNFGCGEISQSQAENNKHEINMQDKIDELIEDYSTWLNEEQEKIEQCKNIVKERIDDVDTAGAFVYVRLINTKKSRCDMLERFISDLERLKGE